MRKIAKFTIIIISLGTICFFASCNNNRPIPFDKERWTTSGSNCINCYPVVRRSTRYRMALWLEKNYSFTDKSLNDVLEKFFIPNDFNSDDFRALESIKRGRVLSVVTRQFLDHNNFVYDTDWLQFHFDENFTVSKVYSVHQEVGRWGIGGNATRRRIQ